MTLTCTLTRGGGRLRALLLVALSFAFGACNGTDHLTNLADETAASAPAAASVALFASSSTSGIPFGVSHVPNEKFGSTYTGALRYIYANHLVSDLEAARQAGTRLIVSFAGADDKYQNGNKSFSLAKWKQQLDSYRNVDFSSYINDGTIVGHYLMDEPHDPANWGGTLVSPATIDEMAKYSKQLWPTLPTIVRSWPAYLKNFNWQYLDAAWAQYSERQGDASQFIRNNVSDARAAGLKLVVGLNILDGGTKASGIRGNNHSKWAMSASQIQSWGSALLDDSYPCAFISWKYDDRYLSRSDIQSAIRSLSQKAAGHASSSCATSRTQGGGAPPPVVEPPVVEPPPVDEPPVDEPPVVQPPVVPPPVVQPPVSEPSTNPSIQLRVSGRTQGRLQLMTLTWNGASGSRVDVYRNGDFRKTTENDRYYVNSRDNRRGARYTYKICEKGTSRCSNSATVSFN